MTFRPFTLVMTEGLLRAVSTFADRKLQRRLYEAVRDVVVPTRLASIALAHKNGTLAPSRWPMEVESEAVALGLREGFRLALYDVYNPLSLRKACRRRMVTIDIALGASMVDVLGRLDA